MPNEIISLVSLLIAMTALLLTLWQNFLTRQAAQAEVFIELEQLGREVHWEDGITLMVSLKDYSDFDTFAKSEPKEIQSQIYDTVHFLNFAAHLVESNFLPRQKVWDIYFWGFRICNMKLLTWWLQGQRKKKYSPLFVTFERMCKRVGKISDEEIAKFDEKRNRMIR